MNNHIHKQKTPEQLASGFCAFYWLFCAPVDAWVCVSVKTIGQARYFVIGGNIGFYMHPKQIVRVHSEVFRIGYDCLAYLFQMLCKGFYGHLAGFWDCFCNLVVPCRITSSFPHHRVGNCCFCFLPIVG